ncbi:MAG: hypothetical protein WC693_03025 [Patescibacteria group bacterium]|jgi:hypothetical protein
MKRQLVGIASVLFIILFLSGCGNTSDQDTNQKANTNTQTTNQTATQDGNTSDDQDSDGFVRMPGEPSRGDDAYYITSEICEQFTKSFMEKLLGKAIIKAAPTSSEATNCQYDLSTPDSYGMTTNILLGLSYLSIDDQVKGHELMDRVASPDSSIPIDNYVIKQENGLINEVYLVLNPNKFISINRSSAKALSEDDVLLLAQKLGQKIKDFK